MIARAAQLVQSWFDSWAKPEFIQAPGEPKHTYYVAHRDRLERVTADPLPRDWEAARLADVVDMVNDGPGKGGRASIFVDSESVKVLFDASTGREGASMELFPTDQWAALQELSSNRQPRTQREFVQMLRTRLVDLVDPDLVSLFRNLKFQIAAETDTQQGHTADSIGKQVRQTVQSAGRDIPEYVTVRPTMYSNAPEIPVTPIRCAVTVDWQSQTITLQPVPLDVERAERDAMDWVQGYLQSECEGVPVYQGAPGFVEDQ